MASLFAGIFDAGISVKNESAVPLLVVLSQVTPLHWGRVEPGETWNPNNRLGVGKVWFTVSVSVYDERNEPSAASVAMRIAAITLAVPLAVPLSFTGLGVALAGAQVGSMAAMVAGTAVMGTAGYTATSVAASAISAVQGISQAGVYADGRTLTVRGDVGEGAVYRLRFVSKEELDSVPYGGPPPQEKIAELTRALTEAAEGPRDVGAAAAGGAADAASTSAAGANATTALLVNANGGAASGSSVVDGPSRSCWSGIQIKNESAVPVLAICSQLTPLHWGRIDPGAVWNAGNEVGMGRVWFTVSISPYDKENEPTQAGVALRLAGIVGSLWLPIPGAAALFFATTPFMLAATVSGITSVQGVHQRGVYADGRVLVIRGSLGSGGAYTLHFASEEEMRAHPYAGPPDQEQVERMRRALAEAGSRIVAPNSVPTKEVRLQAESGPLGFVVSHANSSEALRDIPAFSDAVVTHVSPSSAAHAAGVTVGSSVLSINGQDVSSMPYPEISARLVVANEAKSPAAPLLIVFQAPVDGAAAAAGTTPLVGAAVTVSVV